MFANGPLPDDGQVRFGSVVLSGRRMTCGEHPEVPVAWVTAEPVAENAGELWLDLVATAPAAGLQPFLIADSPPDMSFIDPRAGAKLDATDGARVLVETWMNRADPWLVEQGVVAPFSGLYPGLAPRPEEQLTMAEIEDELAGLPPLYVGLAAVSRPADVLAAVGWWSQDEWDIALPTAAVLRSWESRLGARLLQIGPSQEIRLLTPRPARTVEAAQAIAAELWAVSDAVWGGYDHDADSARISWIAQSIVNEPVWGLWWD
jgi:hypothetical protein